MHDTLEPRGAKERLIQATHELLISKGDLNVTLQDIAKQSGLNSALVKYHFGNKNGLLIEVALWVAVPRVRALTDLVASDLPARRKLEIHLSGMVGLYWHHPYINRLIDSLIRTPEGSEKLTSSIVEPIVRLQGEIIAVGQKSGEFKVLDSGAVYSIIVGACNLNDILHSSKYPLPDDLPARSKEDRQAYARVLTEMLLSGLVNPAAE